MRCYRLFSMMQLPPVEAKQQQQTEDILNSILPPREWQEKGKLWTQSVTCPTHFKMQTIVISTCKMEVNLHGLTSVQASKQPATRLDVVKLQEQLDLKLQQRQARETGICPVRRELYGQVFDELIRHVTINCAERGLLLMRIRDVRAALV